MNFLTNFNQMVIQPGSYNPISAKGGRRRKRNRSRRHKKTNKSRTRRRY
jgi:hypothetical protein